MILIAIWSLNLGLAWNLPLTLGGALLSWVFAFAWACFVLQSERVSYFKAWLGGVVTQCLGFYWLVQTIDDFGGFPIFLAILTGLLFAFAEALQFPLALFLSRKLPQGLDRAGFRVALGWVAAAQLFPRLFPWRLGHSQIGFLPFAQIADIGGVALISFLMLWAATGIVLLFKERKHFLGRLLGPLCCILACLYGQTKIAEFENSSAAVLDVALVQANITTAEKHNIKFFKKNTERYVALSQQVASSKNEVLIVWPESVFLDWVNADTQHSNEDLRLPRLGSNASLLMGALSVRKKAVGKTVEIESFNSSMLIQNDGSIPALYHKRILMPFGEYMPGAKLFPWIQSLNPSAGSFTAGTEQTIFRLKAAPNFSVAPLICYEDVLPSIASEAVRNGATLLINQTNDAWFGKTAAPFQHHQIAAFRAIENRRFLLRSTNSGLTAVVSPTGKTEASLPPFSEAILNTRVTAHTELSWYTSSIGDLPWWILTVIVSLISVFRCKKTLI